MTHTEVLQLISRMDEIYVSANVQSVPRSFVSIPVRETIMSNISATISIVSPTSCSVEIFSAFCALTIGI